MSRTTRGACVLLSLVAGLSGSAAGQAPSDSLAWAGADGIYVWLGGTVVSEAHPVDGIVAHRLERRRAGDDDWSRIMDVQSVETPEALFAPLDSVTRALVPGALGQPDEESAWAHIVQFPSADSLATIIGHPTIRELLGIYAVDRDVEEGDVWEYRISDVTDDGGSVGARVTTPVEYPSDVAFTPVRTLRVEEGDSVIDLWWHIQRGAHPARSLEVWRREGRDGAFELVDSLDFFVLIGDSVQARWRDTGVDPDRQYAYYAVPRDVFLNRGASSDTVTAYTVPLLSLPLPDSIRATGSDGGIRVSWRYAEPERARSIRVHRSTSLDSGWVHVAEVPTRDTSFTDPWMDPARIVYYRLSVTSVRGEESPPTGAVLAHFSSPLTPAPPSAVTVSQAPEGVIVSWAPMPAGDLRGYRVYRTDAPVDTLGAEIPFDAASPLLSPADTAFVDTADLTGGRAYTWAVEAVSRSGVASELSEPVQLAVAPEPPPAPTGVRGRGDGSDVILRWDDMTQVDLVVAGYVVLRGAADDPAAEPQVLTSEPIVAPHNTFRDTTTTAGRPYLYRVRSIDYLDRASDDSPPIRVTAPTPGLLPPPGPRAVPGADGVTVSWDPVPDGAVRIYRYALGAPPTRLAEVPADVGRYLDSDAAAGRRYFYRLTLVADGRESDLGPEVSVRR